MSTILPGGNPHVNPRGNGGIPRTQLKAQMLQTLVRNAVGPSEFQANAQIYSRICGFLAAYEDSTLEHVLDIANTMKTNILGKEGTFTYGDDKAMVILSNCLRNYPDATAEDFAAIYKVFSNQPGIFEIMAERYINQYFNPAPKELPERDYNASLSKAPRNPEETETEPEAPSVPTTGTTIGGTPLGEGAGGFTKAPVSGSDILADQNKLLVGGTPIGITKNAGSDDEEQRLLAMGFNHVFGNDKAMNRALRWGRVKEGDMVVVPGKGGIDGFPYIAYKMQNGELVEITDIFEVQRNFNHQ